MAEITEHADNPLTLKVTTAELSPKLESVDNTLYVSANTTSFASILFIDASKRGNFFTRIYSILKYLFTGKLSI